MTTKIHLKNVRAYGYIGVFPEENVLGQWFEVDATLWVDFETATISDRLEDTFDYQQCIHQIENLIQTSKFALIERLAGVIADALLEHSKVSKVKILVTKQPPIPNFLGSVQVEVKRAKASLPAEKQKSTAQQQTSQALLKQEQIELVTKDSLQAEVTTVETKSNRLAETKHQSNSKRPVIKSIYADGACSGNPGPGGWGVVINYEDGQVQELGGASKQTTNNQMELQAAIAGLEFLAQYGQTEPIEFYTDSRYTIDGISKWIKGWKKNGWQTKDKQPVKNQELWQLLDRLNSSRVDWRWVQGHAGDRDNTRCDEIARAFATGQTPNLRS